jgi:hypothetical protein
MGHLRIEERWDENGTSVDCAGSRRAGKGTRTIPFTVRVAGSAVKKVDSVAEYSVTASGLFDASLII